MKKNANKPVRVVRCRCAAEALLPPTSASRTSALKLSDGVFVVVLAAAAFLHVQIEREREREGAMELWSPPILGLFGQVSETRRKEQMNKKKTQ